ncbi:PhnA domain-containing protein [Streptomyces sp. NPDC059533]
MSDIIFKDSNGTVAQDGDPVTLTKDLKVKGLVLKTEFLKKA